MSKTTVYIVGEDQDSVERAKAYFSALNMEVKSFSPTEWRQGLDVPHFRSQIGGGIPSLLGGQNPLDRSNVLPFPGAPTGGVASVEKVPTMNELEAKAIESAIAQFRGNLTEAARALGIGRATLYRKVKQYNIDPTASRRNKRAA